MRLKTHHERSQQGAFDFDYRHCFDFSGVTSSVLGCTVASYTICWSAPRPIELSTTGRFFCLSRSRSARYSTWRNTRSR